MLLFFYRGVVPRSPDLQAVTRSSGEEWVDEKDEQKKIIGRRIRRPRHFITLLLRRQLALGDLILDSGAPRLVLFGVKSDSGLDEKREWRTVTGSQEVDLVYIKSLTIEGQTIWRGDAVAIPSRAGSNWPAAAQFVQGDICL